MEREEAALIVNFWHSRCSACDQKADPSEKEHQTVLNDKRQKESEGCGAKYTKITSDYLGLDDAQENCVKMRPDLEWTNNNG